MREIVIEKNEAGQRLDKFFDGVLRKKQLHDIAFGEFFISLTLFPVQRDVLLAHHLIEKALRRLIHVLREKFIQCSGAGGKESRSRYSL